jgi:hypothetical protein
VPLVASFPANLAMLARGGAVVETADGVCAGVVPMSGGAATALGMGIDADGRRGLRAQVAQDGEDAAVVGLVRG